MKIDVVDTRNQKVGDLELDDSVFAGPVKPDLFWEVVRMQLANRRSGTHSTKTVSEVSGTGKKPFKQKGTGRARQGSLRASHMRGGGVVHGPRPRDYSYRLPKKMTQGALRSAISLRTSEAKLHVVAGWKPGAPKTAEAVKVLSGFSAAKALVIDTKDNEALRLSLRNVPNAKFLPVDAVNVYDILQYDHLFLSDAAARGLSERLKSRPSRREIAMRDGGK